MGINKGKIFAGVKKVTGIQWASEQTRGRMRRWGWEKGLSSGLDLHKGAAGGDYTVGKSITRQRNVRQFAMQSITLDKSDPN